MQYAVPRVPEFLQPVRSEPRLRELHADAIAAAKPGGLYLEFGVCHGTSIRMLRHLIPFPQVIYGFDSFQGLPEAWNGIPKGGLRCGPFLPPPGVTFIAGWFDQTVPKFAADHAGEFISYMHLDADLYSSTRTVLMELNALIVPGSVMVFDELFGYVGWQAHEHRALTEWAAECGREFHYMARDEHWRASVMVDG